MKRKILSFMASIIIVNVQTAFALTQSDPCWGPSAKQDLMEIDIDKGNAVRHTSYFYQAPSGYKICFAAPYEESANPKENGNTKRFFNKTSKSSQFSVHLPCPGTAIPPAAVGAVAGLLICGATGVGCLVNAVGGTQFVAQISGNQCGVGGTPNWFDGGVLFILLPDAQSCPNSACQLPPLRTAPFERF